MPERIQLRRVKGWRKPEGAVWFQSETDPSTHGRGRPSLTPGRRAGGSIRFAFDPVP